VSLVGLRPPSVTPRARNCKVPTPAAVHLAFAESCSDDRNQLYPHGRDPIDELAEALVQPADSQSVIGAINETRSESAHVSHKSENNQTNSNPLTRTGLVPGFDGVTL